jgi:predicted peroxiredoxin
LFSDELGHPATSAIIAFCSTAQIGMLTHTLLFILAYMSLGQRYGCFMWILAANVIGSYGIVRVVSPPYDELQDLAEQIKA